MGIVDTYVRNRSGSRGPEWLRRRLHIRLASASHAIRRRFQDDRRVGGESIWLNIFLFRSFSLFITESLVLKLNKKLNKRSSMLLVYWGCSASSRSGAKYLMIPSILAALRKRWQGAVRIFNRGGAQQSGGSFFGSRHRSFYKALYSMKWQVCSYSTWKKGV